MQKYYQKYLKYKGKYLLVQDKTQTGGAGVGVASDIIMEYHRTGKYENGAIFEMIGAQMSSKNASVFRLAKYYEKAGIQLPNAECLGEINLAKYPSIKEISLNVASEADINLVEKFYQKNIDHIDQIYMNGVKSMAAYKKRLGKSDDLPKFGNILYFDHIEPGVFTIRGIVKSGYFQNLANVAVALKGKNMMPNINYPLINTESDKQIQRGGTDNIFTCSDHPDYMKFVIISTGYENNLANEPLSQLAKFNSKHHCKCLAAYFDGAIRTPIYDTGTWDKNSHDEKTAELYAAIADHWIAKYKSFHPVSVVFELLCDDKTADFDSDSNAFRILADVRDLQMCHIGYTNDIDYTTLRSKYHAIIATFDAEAG